MKKLFLYACLIGLFVSQLSFAAGFALYEGSARGNALGGLTGSADDASAIFFNPSGMTQLPGLQFMVGGTLIAPSAEISMHDQYSGNEYTGEFDSQIFTPPHIYLTYQVNDKLWVGGGIYTRFGLGSKYDPSWAGRYSNINTQIKTISYGVDLAYKLNDNVSFGFGVNGMWFDASLEQAVDAKRFQLNPPHNPESHEYDAIQLIEGNNTSFGWNVSASYHNDKISLGAMYVSSVEHDLEGTARWTRPQASVPFFWFNDSNITAETIELPDMIWLGATFKATDKAAITAGLVRTNWSSIQELVFHYETPFVILPAIGEINVARRELNWKDSNRYNVGLEYKYSDHMTLMGSVIVDDSPIDEAHASYLLPTNDRVLYNAGLSLQMEKWLVTSSYMYLTSSDLDFDNRQTSEGVLEGTASGDAHLLGLSLSRKF